MVNMPRTAKAEMTEGAMAKILTKEQRAATKQHIKEEVMKACIEEFRTSGDADIAAQKLSMAYLLMTLGNSYAEECVDLDVQTPHRPHQGQDHNNLVILRRLEQGDVFNDWQNANLFCNDTSLLNEILDTFLTDHITVERGPYFQPKFFYLKNIWTATANKPTKTSTACTPNGRQYVLINDSEVVVRTPTSRHQQYGGIIINTDNLPQIGNTGIAQRGQG